MTQIDRKKLKFLLIIDIFSNFSFEISKFWWDKSLKKLRSSLFKEELELFMVDILQNVAKVVKNSDRYSGKFLTFHGVFCKIFERHPFLKGCKKLSNYWISYSVGVFENIKTFFMELARFWTH